MTENESDTLSYKNSDTETDTLSLKNPQENSDFSKRNETL